MNWLFEKLEARINGLITRRILLFHDALVRRGQIPEAPKEPGPQVENSDLQSRNHEPDI